MSPIELHRHWIALDEPGQAYRPAPMNLLAPRLNAIDELVAVTAGAINVQSVVMLCASGMDKMPLICRISTA